MGRKKRIERFRILLFVNASGTRSWRVVGTKSDGTRTITKGPGTRVNSRERLFSPQVSFWAFAAQILNPGTACREIARWVEARWQETSASGTAPSTSESAYCRARARLDPATLRMF